MSRTHLAGIAWAYGALVLVAVLLHLAWERAHVVLYTDYGNLGGNIPVWVYATAGDAMYTLLGVFAMMCFGHSFTSKAAWSPRGYMLLAIIGACIAVFVEYKAQYFDLWSYALAMPLIPLLGLGLSPVLQMVTLLPLSVLVARALLRRGAGNTGKTVYQ